MTKNNAFKLFPGVLKLERKYSSLSELPWAKGEILLMLVKTLRPDLFDEDTDSDCQTPAEKTDLALQICSIHFSIQVKKI